LTIDPVLSFWGAPLNSGTEIILILPDLDNTSEGKEENRRGLRVKPELLLYSTAETEGKIYVITRGSQDLIISFVFI
jgi:hypothetical protein